MVLNVLKKLLIFRPFVYTPPEEFLENQIGPLKQWELQLFFPPFSVILLASDCLIKFSPN